MGCTAVELETVSDGWAISRKGLLLRGSEPSGERKEKQRRGDQNPTCSVYRQARHNVFRERGSAALSGILLARLGTVVEAQRGASSSTAWPSPVCLELSCAAAVRTACKHSDERAWDNSGGRVARREVVWKAEPGVAAAAAEGFAARRAGCLAWRPSHPAVAAMQRTEGREWTSMGPSKGEPGWDGRDMRK